MLLLKLLYDVTLGIPVTISKKTLEALVQQIDKERLITEDSIKQKLQQLQVILQEGGMSEEDYEAQETILMERLKAVREYQKEAE